MSIFERLRARRELRAVPELDATTPEGSVARATGVVRIAERTLVAPLSGVTCVAVRARVRVRNLMPGEQMSIVPFLLERESGDAVLIESTHAQLALAPVRRAPTPDDERRRDSFRILQAVSDVKSVGARFEEVVLEPGMRVAVVGLVMKDIADEAAEESGFREEMPVAYRLAGNIDHPLVIG